MSAIVILVSYLSCVHVHVIPYSHIAFEVLTRAPSLNVHWQTNSGEAVRAAARDECDAAAEQRAQDATPPVPERAREPRAAGAARTCVRQRDPDADTRAARTPVGGCRHLRPAVARPLGESTSAAHKLEQVIAAMLLSLIISI